MVRSAVAGVVSDVRVTSVGVRGVNLTVIILEHQTLVETRENYQ